jgi:flavin-dependent dehydrogenase
MEWRDKYDVAIIGGGLAGLAAAIQLSKLHYSVVLFEKEKYPFHKVCGEYVSMESWNFLQELGLPLQKMDLPQIDTLLLTAPNGRSFTAKLPLGGFGISRYALDHALAQIAMQNGVHVLEETKVTGVQMETDFAISFNRRAEAGQNIKARICFGAYGKRSNLDVKWKRNFLEATDKKTDNYVAVKYHIKYNWPEGIIGLHNFENGYCGISGIEGDTCCLCYMTTAKNLKASGNDIQQLQRQFLYKNPHLKKILTGCEIVNEFPVTISQISFDKKTCVENHVLMLGDAAGMITPLCGNGMSIALHTSGIAAQLANDFLSGKTDRAQLEKKYEDQWKKYFSKRLQTGRVLQRFFGGNTTTNLFVGFLKAFPFMARPLIKMTHGKPF